MTQLLSNTWQNSANSSSNAIDLLSGIIDQICCCHGRLDGCCTYFHGWHAPSKFVIIICGYGRMNVYWMISLVSPLIQHSIPSAEAHVVTTRGVRFIPKSAWWNGIGLWCTCCSYVIYCYVQHLRAWYNLSMKKLLGSCSTCTPSASD